MKLNELKVELAKQILASEDEEQLQTVDQLLNPSDQFKLSAAQKAELDRDFKDYKAGKGANYTWAEVKSHVRGLRGK
ncbi:MAG: addiction module protein [Flavobacteriales bacterium]